MKPDEVMAARILSPQLPPMQNHSTKSDSRSTSVLTVKPQPPPVPKVQQKPRKQVITNIKTAYHKLNVLKQKMPKTPTSQHL